jgi:hypothetical protein
LLTLLVNLPVLAQQAGLIASEAPYYIGVPIDVQVFADGFSEEPQPQIEATPPEQGQLKFLGISPNISTSVQIINGQMSQSKTVRFVYRYTFTAEQPVDYKIGPFRVSQGSNEASTSSITLTLGDIPQAANQSVQLLVPDKPVYVGQRIPLRLEWWTDAQLRGKLMNSRIQLPLLDRLSEFQISEVENADANTTLVIDSASGSKEYKATARIDNRNGKQYIVYAIDLIVTPLKAGDYQLDPVTITVDEVVRWRRNLFGDRVPVQIQKQRIGDSKRILMVMTPPLNGRPESFAGAIGRGFDLEVSTDRSVVQVGDPITLTLTLHGDTAVDTLSLPPLANLGLAPAAFRLPEAEIAGEVTDNGKRFQATLRVLDDSVREIPPLAFSWFDPDSGQYQTTRSQPIALSVRAAQIVSAKDVVSGVKQDEPKPAAPEQNSAPTPASGAGGTPSDGNPGRPRFTLNGADLSIATDMVVLALPAGPRFGGLTLQLAGYGLGLLALALALFKRRRSELDPVLSARLKQLKQQRNRIANTDKMSELATTLRKMMATASTFPRAEFDVLLAECDDRIYAPGGASAAIDQTLRQRALGLADMLLEKA